MDMSYNLRRIRDGKGDMGGSSESIKWNDDGTFNEISGAYPTIGESMKVGSIAARSYSDKDWWLTTEVTKILEETSKGNGKYVRFKTGNSEYEWWTGIYPKEIKK